MDGRSYIFRSTHTYILTTTEADVGGDVVNVGKRKRDGEEKRNKRTRESKVDGQACDRLYSMCTHIVYIEKGIMRMCSFCA